VRLLLVLALFAGNAAAQNTQEIQRALIQRDQQSAEFAQRGVEARRALENLHADQLRDAGRPLSPDPVIARELLPYERQTMARERMMLPPIDQPAIRSGSDPDLKALPLPGSDGPPHLVMPISTPSIGG